MVSESPIMGMWVEKYRPRTLEEAALDEEQKTLLRSFLEAKEIPHLLFTGPPGCGKTTVAKILNRGIPCEVLALNASKDRGIDVIRDRIGTFAKISLPVPWKHIFLDEADGLTPDAQNSLRNTMEEFHDQTRFILTANNSFKIISPIQSRCTVVEFGNIPIREKVLVLKRILDAEGVKHEIETVLSYANKYNDLRRMIMAAQRAVKSSKDGSLPLPAGNEVSPREMLTYVSSGQWEKLVGLASNSSFDPRQALKDMFWAVANNTKDYKKPSTWMFIMGKAVHEGGWTPDPSVHFLGTMAELIERG